MTTLSISVSTGTGDGSSGTGSGYSHAASQMPLGGYYGTANCWLNVLNVTIAPGSTISSNTATLIILSRAGTAADLRFRYEDADNPTYPTSGSDYDGRARTTAELLQTNSSGTGSWTSNSFHASGQEVIDRGGWASGNAKQLFIEDNGSSAHYGAFENRITVYSLDSGSGTPQINWTYSSSIQAPVVVGTVSLTGVALTCHKKPAVAVGSITFTGISPTVPTAINAAVVPGTITFAGVSPGTSKSAESPIGTVAFSGVSPATTHRAAITVGTLVVAGVSPTAAHLAAVPAGTVTITGVSLSTRTSAGVPIGTVSFAGVSPSTAHESAVTVGTFTLAGVALTSTHSAAVTVGTFALAGVSPTTLHSAATPIGSVTFAGVGLGSQHSHTLPVGDVMFTPINEIQEVRYNEAGDGWFVQLSYYGTPINFTTGDTEQDLQNNFDNQIGSGHTIVTRYPDGFTVEFIGPSAGANINELTIVDDPSGSVTIHTIRHGMTGNTITVRKSSDPGTGTVTLSGVSPGTRKTAASPVGSVVFSGVSPESIHSAAVSVGSITVSGVSPDTRYAAAVSVGSFTVTGVVPATSKAAATPIGQVVFTGVALTTGADFVHTASLDGCLSGASATMLGCTEVLATLQGTIVITPTLTGGVETYP